MIILSVIILLSFTGKPKPIDPKELGDYLYSCAYPLGQKRNCPDNRKAYWILQTREALCTSAIADKKIKSQQPLIDQIEAYITTTCGSGVQGGSVQNFTPGEPIKIKRGSGGGITIGKAQIEALMYCLLTPEQKKQFKELVDEEDALHVEKYMQQKQKETDQLKLDLRSVQSMPEEKPIIGLEVITPNNDMQKKAEKLLEEFNKKQTPANKIQYDPPMIFSL